MLIQTFAIRLLTVLVYFLPFTFFMTDCDGKEEIIYDKSKIWELKQVDIKHDMRRIDKLICKNDTSQITDKERQDSIEGILRNNLEYIFKPVSGKWYDKLFCPAPHYLSGFGLLVVKTKTTGMAISMWMSVILSVVTFLFWRFIARWMIAVLFVGVNFIVVLIYMISCLRQNVSLEYGFWLLFFLLLIQLWVEMRQLKYSIIGRLFSNINK